MNNKTKFGIFTILIAISLTLVSISAISAAAPEGAFDGIVRDTSSEYVGLGVKNQDKTVFSAEKVKLPAKYKKYENLTKFQVAKGKKISYKAMVNSQGNFIYDLKGIKVKKASITFGDGAKKTSTGWISHTYKKSGKWYLIKVTIVDATFSSSKNAFVSGTGMSISNGTVTNVTKEYLVYVANKPQISVISYTKYASSPKELKKGNANYMTVKITNVGSVSTKATKIKIWYEHPNGIKDIKMIGKVHPKLKKYTASANLKALKPGKSTTVRINFKIPASLAKYVKVINPDSANKNKNQMSKSIFRFI